MYPKLNPDEVICDKCNGEGVREVRYVNYRMRHPCRKCDTKGKLDWIEVITGKKETYP